MGIPLLKQMVVEQCDFYQCKVGSRTQIVVFNYGKDTLAHKLTGNTEALAN